MHRIARGALVGLVSVHLCVACSSGGSGGSDGGPLTDASPRPDGPDSTGPFHHFAIELRPAVPLVEREVELRVIAYSSEDSSTVLGYSSTISVTASAGTLSGDTEGAPLTRGQATLTIVFDSPGEDITLTVTDDADPARSTTSAPIRVSPPGDLAQPLEVVINEVNWFGTSASTADEWIELRNTTGAPLNLSEWTIENAGSAASPTIQLDNGTVIPAGGYLVIGARQGADQDGMRTSLTGVAGVQLQPLSLTNAGEQLILRDPAGTDIDRTPEGPWPAGSNQADLSMERRDELTGGGYTDGSAPGAWYTWDSLDGTDTTSPDSSDRGTPGADNTAPDLFGHFSFAVSPDPPRAGVDFTLSLTAHASSGAAELLSGYQGSVSITASPGPIAGQLSGRPVVDGAAAAILRLNTPNTTVTLTVTDDLYPRRTGSVEVFVRPQGDTALTREVVISEVNWYGSGTDTSDEWIELRNLSGAARNLSGWTIDAAGSGSNPITIAAGTTLPAGGYLVLARRQGEDAPGSRTSVTGVAGVQVIPGLSLANGGELLVLRDVEGTAIDATPSGPWPAGSSTQLISMQRRDDLTGGGYTDGSVPAAWYSWRAGSGVDTTHPDTLDRGTPGADNGAPPVPLYATGFEAGDPAWENLSTGGFSNVPPAGTSARTGVAVVTTDSITQGYTGRQIQSVDCIPLAGDVDPVIGSAWGTASTDNGDNLIRARIRFLWYTDAACATAHDATPEGGPTLGTVLPQGGYTEVSGSVAPPAGAASARIRLQVQYDNNGGTGTGWAADDVLVSQ
jgi:hypothetical protein